MAETLSRAYLPDSHDDSSMNEGMKVMVRAVARDVPMRATWKARIQAEAAEDPELQMLYGAVMLGCPKHENSSPAIVQGYWAVKNDIHVADGMLGVEGHVIELRSMPQEMLALLSKSHKWSEKTMVRARYALYWPSMSINIEKTSRQLYPQVFSREMNSQRNH